MKERTIRRLTTLVLALASVVVLAALEWLKRRRRKEL